MNLPKFTVCFANNIELWYFVYYEGSIYL